VAPRPKVRVRLPPRLAVAPRAPRAGRDAAPPAPRRACPREVDQDPAPGGETATPGFADPGAPAPADPRRKSRPCRKPADLAGLVDVEQLEQALRLRGLASGSQDAAPALLLCTRSSRTAPHRSRPHHARPRMRRCTAPHMSPVHFVLLRSALLCGPSDTCTSPRDAVFVNMIMLQSGRFRWLVLAGLMNLSEVHRVFRRHQGGRDGGGGVPRDSQQCKRMHASRNRLAQGASDRSSTQVAARGARDVRVRRPWLH